MIEYVLHSFSKASNDMGVTERVWEDNKLGSRNSWKRIFGRCNYKGYNQRISSNNCNSMLKRHFKYMYPSAKRGVTAEDWEYLSENFILIEQNIDPNIYRDSIRPRIEKKTISTPIISVTPVTPVTPTTPVTTPVVVIPAVKSFKEAKKVYVPEGESWLESLIKWIKKMFNLK